MSANLIRATALTFDGEVLRADLPVVVDFYADWCPPCKLLAPVLERLSGELEGRVKFVKVNVDEEPDLGDRFGITGVPTLILFKDGEPVDTIVGFLPRQELKEKLEGMAV